MERRLAAILVADVVGYSRLMGVSEAGTLAELQAHRRELVDGKIAEHHGRIVKLTGDGMLAEFPSVVNAVVCAVEIQRKMVERNVYVAQDRRIEFRIGVNLGDIIFEDNDIFGDGVNVAARIESIAKPGGVCVSSSVRDNVGNRLNLAFEDMGEQTLKNIDRPVRVYNVSLDAGSLPATTPQAAAKVKPSIAVLPFTNMSGDPEQEYFGDGITEDIITELSRFHSLSVIARNSSFSFKGRSVDIAEVGRKLGVRYVVEGSVRKASQRVRITVQLIEAAAGQHIWAERYDRELKDIFAVQDEVTERIVWALTGKVDMAEIARSKRRPVSNLDAYDLVLRGAGLMNRYTRESVAAAVDLIKKASELDPNTGWIWSWLAEAYLLVAFLHYEWSKFDLAVEGAERALALGDAEDWTDAIVAYVAAYRRDYQEAEIRLSRAMARNPHNPITAETRMYVRLWQGQTEEAYEIAKRVVSLDPVNPVWFYEFLAYVNYLRGDYRASLQAFKQCMPVGYYVSYAFLAACLGQLGQIEEAQAAWRRCLELRPGFTLEAYARESPMQPRDREHWLDGLRKVGLPE